jgi:4-carboxymuconolactone decarboxylase
MTASVRRPANFSAFDDATRALVRLAAVVTGGREDDVRASLAGVADTVPHPWVEELLLQTYLFAGFPRALNAMREWRRVQPNPVDTDADTRGATELRASGEETCATVYGEMYERLRDNVRALHPALDEWMITEGYGKVLSRSALDLPRRELCIVAACAAADQGRQLHSHLHGALNAGVAAHVLDATLESLADVVTAEQLRSARLLWARVRGK